MKSLAIGLSLLLAGTMMLAQTNPVPFVNQPLVPSATAPGGPSFTLTANGTGFVSGSVIKWNGTALSTTFVNGSQLTATVPASNIVKASTASITVTSPTPGGGTSNVVFFTVSEPTNLQFTNLSANDIAVNGLIVADFNNDGNLDFAVSSCPGSSCSGDVFIGNGQGTFQGHFGVFGGGSFFWFSAADFNGDGKLDIVETEFNDGDPTGNCTSYVYLGNGDGTFSSGYSYYGLPCGAPLVGDFNRDGKLDFALWGNWMGPVGIYVFLGNGDGTFQNPVLSDATSSYSLAAVGDFNGDGKLDLIGFLSTGIAFIQGNGDGTFQTPSTSYTLGPNTDRVIAADLNGDAKLDLIAVQNSPTNTFTVLLGNGDGTFNLQTPVSVGSSLSGGAIGDLNADGKLDLILSDDTNTLIMPGNGDGTFQSPVQLPYGSIDAAVGDFNNDGKLDLVLGPAGNLLLQGGILAKASPANLNFPAQLVGTKSAAQVVTLSNVGSAVLTVTSIGITGANASDFGQTNTCDSTLAINASCPISVTFTPTAGGGRVATLTISSNGVGSPQTVALTGGGQDFSLTSESSTTATISPGQTASYGVTVDSEGGFNQTVTFSCSGAPAQSNCSVLPSSLKLSGSLTAIVTVTATAPSTASLGPTSGIPTNNSRFRSWAELTGALGFVLLASWAGLRRHPGRRLVLHRFALLLLLSIGTTMSGCGGGNGSGGTPTGSYTLTVTGTSSGSSTLTHALKFTLIVQ